jgi:hypothetical protein
MCLWPLSFCLKNIHPQRTMFIYLPLLQLKSTTPQLCVSEGEGGRNVYINPSSALLTLFCIPIFLKTLLKPHKHEFHACPLLLCSYAVKKNSNCQRLMPIPVAR